MPRSHDDFRAAAPARRNGARDSEHTQASILAAATLEFARYGLGGARVDRIAQRAKTNKRMLYYYYGSKDELFRSVMQDTYARIRRAEQSLSLLDAEPVESVRRLVKFTWNYYLKHPEFLTLLNSENLHRAIHLRQLPNVRELNSPVIETLGNVLQRGVHAGVFRGDVEPLQLYITIAALSYFYLSNNHTLSAVFGRDLSTPQARGDRLRHMTDVVLGYLRPDSNGHLSIAA